MKQANHAVDATPIEVLLVEDNPADARLLIELLKDVGADAFRVKHATYLSAAIAALKAERFDVVLMDLSLPDSTGLDTINRLQAASPDVPIVVLTGLHDEAVALQAVRQGVQDYLVKGRYEGELASRALRYAVERHRIRAELRESDERFRALAEFSPNAILVDVGGRCVYANAAALRLVGAADASEVIGHSHLEFVDPQDRESVRERLRKVRELHEIAPLSAYRWRRRDGSPVDVEVTKAPFIWESKPAVQIVARDITQRVRAEERLRRSEARLRAVLDHLPVGVWFTDAQGRIVFGNPAGQRVWGGARYVGPDEFHQYKGWRPETGQPIEPQEWALTRAVRSGEATLNELVEIESFDGARKLILNSAVPVRDADGALSGAVVINEDVTERRRAEETLRDREARYRAVVETASDAIITVDEKGAVESLNPAAERIFGYSAAEAIGRDVGILMPELQCSQREKRIRTHLHAAGAADINTGREMVGVRKDGSTFPLDLSISEFQINHRRMFTIMVHDATTRRRLQQQIIEASAAEQRRIGHELHDGLCQQLTAISFSIELLRRKLKGGGGDGEPIAQRIADEMMSATKLARTLSHGLNPIDINVGGLAPALRGLASKVSESYQTQCRFQRRGILPAIDAATSTHLYRIAQEAINNAVRHGKATRVDLILAARKGVVSFRVIDNGRGFPRGLSHARAGIGLQTMRYRAGMIGATFDVAPGDGGGTVVTCSLSAKQKLIATENDQLRVSRAPAVKSRRRLRARSN